MNTRHLAAIKSSELRHRYFTELGATKLACLWVVEHLGKTRHRERTHGRCFTSVDPVLDRHSQRQVNGEERSRRFCLLHVLHRVVHQPVKHPPPGMGMMAAPCVSC